MAAAHGCPPTDIHCAGVVTKPEQVRYFSWVAQKVFLCSLVLVAHTHIQPPAGTSVNLASDTLGVLGSLNAAPNLPLF